MARIFFEDTMVFGSLSSTAAAGIIAGSVNTYADLPDATTNNGKLYYVKTGSIGALGFYKYPRGFYYSTGGIWQGGRIQVNVSQDTNSFVNITNWATFLNSDPSFNAGDVVRYNNVFYKNLTGSSSATAPASDTTNWKSLKLNAENQYYISSGGDNTADGLTQPTAVQDFSTALGLASAGDFIYCEDGSSFDEDIDGVANVGIFAPKATLSNTSNNNLVMEGGVYVFDTIEGDNDNSLVLNSGSDYSLLVANNIHLLSGGSGVAIRNSVNSLLDVKVKQFSIIGDGDGIGDFTGVTAHTHIEIDDFYLHSTGDAISVNNSGEVVGTVQHCSYVSGGSGNFVNVTDGTVDLNCHLIESDINIGASGTANLKINKMTGDITVASGGTLYINCPEFSGTLTNSGTVFGQLGDKFYGVNNFQSFPLTPSSAPTSDYEVANKKYVDDEIGGVLASVSTDATLAGDGTAGDPLGIDLTNSNTWIGGQTFSGGETFTSSITQTNGMVEFLKDANDNDLSIYYDATNKAYNFNKDRIQHDWTYGAEFSFEDSSSGSYIQTASDTFDVNMTGGGAGRVWFSGEAVFNRVSGDYDFYVNGDSETGLFYDASLGKTSLGMTAQFTDSKLSILGDGTSNAFQLTMGTNETTTATQFSRIGTRHYNPAEKPLLMMHGYSASSVNYVRIGGGNSGGNAATQISFYTAANTTTTFGTVRGSINSDGKWSVGSEDFPDAQLTVQQGTDDGNVLTFKSTDVSHPFTSIEESDTYSVFQKYNSVAGGMQFSGFTESGSDTAIGFSGFSGDTSPDSSTGTSSNGVLDFTARKSNGGTSFTSLGNSENIAAFRNNTTSRFIFKGDGTGYADSSWSTYSDKRVKKDIKDLPYGLKEVLKIEPKIYKRYSGSVKDGVVKLEDNYRMECGVIAQDVYNIIPEICDKPKDDKNSLWGFDYDHTVPILIQAIKDLNAKVENLKKKLKEE